MRMKFENLIYHHEGLRGKQIKETFMTSGELVLTTEDNYFAILIPKIEEDDDGYHDEYVRVLDPSEVFRKLRQDARVRNYLKTRGVIDFEEFERRVKAENEEYERKQVIQRIEREKALLAELKAKYEGENQ